MASLLSSYVHHPTVAHIMEANRAAPLLRTSAGQKLIIWLLDPFTTHFALVSDCSGAGMASEERAQAAWMVMATEKDLAAGISAKVSVIAWRSSRLRRVVASTRAGETLALTQGVAELEWV